LGDAVPADVHTGETEARGPEPRVARLAIERERLLRVLRHTAPVAVGERDLVASIQVATVARSSEEVEGTPGIGRHAQSVQIQSRQAPAVDRSAGVAASAVRVGGLALEPSPSRCVLGDALTLGVALAECGAPVRIAAVAPLLEQREGPGRVLRNAPAVPVQAAEIRAA